MLMSSSFRKLAMAASLLVAFGTVPANAAGWTPPLTVSSGFVEDTDLIVVYTADGTQYAPGCTANTWIIAGANDDRRARVWATILTALAAGKKVRFWYTDTCAVWTYHSATAVMIHAN
jgi:hypothetical protein